MEVVKALTCRELHSLGVQMCGLVLLFTLASCREPSNLITISLFITSLHTTHNELEAKAQVPST
jgi:hypothetical protein